MPTLTQQGPSDRRKIGQQSIGQSAGSDVSDEHEANSDVESRQGAQPDDIRESFIKRRRLHPALRADHNEKRLPQMQGFRLGQPAVNDSPAGDVMVGCGEAAMIRLSAVTDSPDGTRQDGELSRPASYGGHAPCDTSWVTQPCGSRATNVKRNEPSAGNSHRGGPACLTAAAKARTQQSPPRLPRPLGPGRTETGGRISWTSRFFTSTRPGSIRWARTSTTQKSSRPSISTR
jgi:hypothetical protein